jgi:hypothetical protein
MSPRKRVATHPDRDIPWKVDLYLARKCGLICWSNHVYVSKGS